MKKSRFTETQIVSTLKEADAGMKVADVCRRHGISQPTYYNWKSKYGGMSASELKRIKELEAEHSKFKRMDADLAMENNALKKLIEKKTLRPTEKREAVEWLKEGHRLPVTRACQAVGLSRSGSITARNSSHSSSSPGVGATEFVFIISSPANPPRTPTSSASIAPSVTRSSTPTSSAPSARFATSSTTWIISYNEERPHAALGNLPPTVALTQQSDNLFWFTSLLFHSSRIWLSRSSHFTWTSFIGADQNSSITTNQFI
jgi:transposase InsO family protein